MRQVPLIQQKSKRLFTLLEVMVAIAILAIGAGAVAWRMQDAVRKKEFTSEIERLRARVIASQKLAIAMQADWRGTLSKKGDEWIFETVCEEGKKFTPLKLKSLQIYLNGKKLEGSLPIDFFASGQILPVGELLFTHKSGKISWKIPELFERQEGRVSGPIYPGNPQT